MARDLESLLLLQERLQYALPILRRLIYLVARLRLCFGKLSLLHLLLVLLGTDAVFACRGFGGLRLRLSVKTLFLVLNDGLIFGKERVGHTVQTQDVEVVADQIICLLVEASENHYELVKHHCRVRHPGFKLFPDPLASSRPLDVQ